MNLGQGWSKSGDRGAVAPSFGSVSPSIGEKFLGCRGILDGKLRSDKQIDILYAVI